MGAQGELSVYVCICKGLRESDVRRMVAGRHVDPDLLVEVLNLDDPGNCGRCIRDIEAIIRDAGGTPAAPPRLAQAV